ncbi:MAG: hypothetical protein WC780_04220 [Lentimicrobiaceae bacterium]|jgi:hypothetical protein
MNLFKKSFVGGLFLFILLGVYSQTNIVNADYCTYDHFIPGTTTLQNSTCTSRTFATCTADPYYHLNRIMICKWVTSASTPPPPVVILEKDPNRVKNKVMKSVGTGAGSVYLNIFVDKLTSGGCTLQNNGVNVDNYVYKSDFNIKSKTVSSLTADENNFQLNCAGSSSPSLTSVIQNVKAQTGVLTIPATCTIPLGGSSCPSNTTLFSWSTTNPYSTSNMSYYTQVKNEATGSAVSSPTNTMSSVGVAVPYTSGGAKYKMWNYVDGENNTVSIPTNQPSDYSLKTIITNCASGSWNGSICAAAPTVTSPTCTNITATSMTAGATVTSLGYPTSITRGTCVGGYSPTNCAAEGGTTTGVLLFVPIRKARNMIFVRNPL